MPHFKVAASPDSAAPETILARRALTVPYFVRLLAGRWAAGVLLLVIALYAWLFPLGKWQPDEFIQFHNIAVDGWRPVVERIFGWSPRPVSELLLWGYGSVVNATDRPLVVAFLACLWALLLVCPYVAARGGCERPALVTLALVSAFLLLDKPGEMFFWPAAAAAYLVGITALAVAVVARPVWLRGVAMLVAAWCNEVAATAVLIDAILLLVLRASPRLRTAIGWHMPLLAGAAAALVICVLMTHRLGIGIELVHLQGGTEGRFGDSLAAAVPDFLLEVGGLPLSPTVTSIPAGLAVKTLLFFGFRPGVGERPWAGAGMRVQAIMFGVAMLLAGLASLVLAYRQFGYGCCERHVTFRAALVVLALFSFAQAWPTRMRQQLRAVLLVVPLLGVLMWRLDDISADRRLIVENVASRAENWESGRSPGPAMGWQNPPSPHLTNDWLFEPGTYRRVSDTELGALDWRVFAVMVFFGKSEMRVR